MLSEIKSEICSFREIDLHYKLGAIGGILSVIFYFESPTVKLYALSVLYGSSLSATIGLIVEKVRNGSDIRTGVLVSITLLLFIIGFKGALDNTMNPDPQEKPKKNIFEGECKLHLYAPMHSSWYYQDCDKKELKAICQEKAANLIKENQEVNLKHKNKTWMTECEQANAISEGRYLDVICQEKSGLSYNDQDKCRERGFEHDWN